MRQINLSQLMYEKRLLLVLDQLTETEYKLKRN
jgi:hypothetical protein